MKILKFSQKYYPHTAGAEVFAQEVGERLAEEGHDVHVVTGLWDKNLEKNETHNGVRIHRFRAFTIPNLQSLSCIPSMYWTGVKLDKEINFDVFHAHLAFPAGQAGALAKFRRRKPLLITVQGGDLVDYKETTAKFGGVLRPVISGALKRADLVQGVSKYTANRASELGAHRTKIIPNGIDTDVFHPIDKVKARKTLGLNPDLDLVVTTSRLTPKNGLDDLIKAVSLLNNKKEHEAKLIIVGEGHQRRALEHLTEELGLKEKIMFEGFVPHKDIPLYLNAADVFARPSLDEGFGISFIEAMACKTPVIGTKIGGITEIITDGETGILTPAQNVNSLTNAIERVLSNGELRERLASNGYEVAKSDYTWGPIVEEMKELYSSII